METLIDCLDYLLSQTILMLQRGRIALRRNALNRQIRQTHQAADALLAQIKQPKPEQPYRLIVFQDPSQNHFNGPNNTIIH